MALHPYWTLDADGRAGLRLRVDADRYTALNDHKIPTGALARVEGTIFDLRALASPSAQIDHNFCLNSGDPAISLQGKDVQLDISTDAPGVQIYSGKDIGIAIEPQHWPDAMHHPHFPSILLTPGETYQQTSTYQFSRA
jgi:aldose 1-epimerase